MSNSALAEFDAMAFPLLEALGMADSAVYTPPTGPTVACTVLVDIGAEEVPPDFRGARRDRLTFRLAEVVPVAGGSVLVDGTTYVLGERDRRDESGASWWARV